MNKEDLKSSLRGLRSESDLQKDRVRTEQFLKNMDPKVLSFAEQELIEEGVDPEELRKLCVVHLQAIPTKEENLKIEPTHPISILKEKHDVILENLQALEWEIERINTSESFKQIENEPEEIERMAHILIEAEKHHQREEALFPLLEKRGTTGLPKIMRIEHEDLRAWEEALKTL